MKTNQTSLISIKEKIADIHRQYKELEEMNPRYEKQIDWICFLFVTSLLKITLLFVEMLPRSLPTEQN